MKLEGGVGAASPAVRRMMQGGGGDQTISTHAHTNSQRKHHMHQNVVVDSTFDYAESSNFE
jgi:hypothetical protein